MNRTFRDVGIQALLALIMMATGLSQPSLAADPSLREQIGQMIMIGFVGHSVRDRRFGHLTQLVRDGEIGGVLYLPRNIAGRERTAAMNAALQSAAEGRPLLLIAVDQEGGHVQRLKPGHGFRRTPPASNVARQMSPQEARQTYLQMAQGLADWGFNLNLGPVVDLNLNPRNPIIGRLGRAYSSDPRIVADYASAFIDAHREAGVATALKHFPGHGSSSGDSHDGAVDVSASWSRAELLPYRELIARGQADIVMTAHVRNSRLQGPGESGPASLSPTAIEGVLRGELGFAGLVISDDLQMEGVAGGHDLRQRVLRAVRAGTDILLLANDKRPDLAIAGKVARILEEAAARDDEMRRRIRQSYERIVAFKARISGETPPQPEPVANPAPPARHAPRGPA